ncbi:NAD(P)/FAD-dependent oxidoreductase [Vibrio sp. RC27]
MKIAIIGSGISGLTSAYYLHEKHDITVYEANDYIGGHTATVDVEVDSIQYAIDTGFIVYNDRTYPNFIKLMSQIGVKGNETEMSFSVRNDQTGLEYNGHTVTTLFAQKKNLFKPSFYSLIFEILRFNRLAKAHATQSVSESYTLGHFLDDNAFSSAFNQNYILPMGAAIWSSTMADMRAFPLGFFLRFFLNHGLLDVVNRPQWYVIEGGSRSYIEPLIAGFKDRIRLNSPVTRVTRDQSGVMIESNHNLEQYDQVIFACHSDQALSMLDAPSEHESSILSAIEYQSNDVILHTDERLLPKSKAAWAAWNYCIERGNDVDLASPCLTYDMNILQHIKSDKTFCVSLNSVEKINPEKVLRRFNYHHPLFSIPAIEAQSKRSLISGINNTWYCGAYWRNGFHEDGVWSALEVVKNINLSSSNVDDGVS